MKDGSQADVEPGAATYGQQKAPLSRGLKELVTTVTFPSLCRLCAGGVPGALSVGWGLNPRPFRHGGLLFADCALDKPFGPDCATH